jgi:hypothetical protein
VHAYFCWRCSWERNTRSSILNAGSTPQPAVGMPASPVVALVIRLASRGGVADWEVVAHSACRIDTGVRACAGMPVALISRCNTRQSSTRRRTYPTRPRPVGEAWPALLAVEPQGVVETLSRDHSTTSRMRPPRGPTFDAIFENLRTLVLRLATAAVSPRTIPVSTSVSRYASCACDWSELVW